MNIFTSKNRSLLKRTKSMTNGMKKIYSPVTHLLDINEAPKTGVLKNGLITLRKITPSDARNSQQLFRDEKMQHDPSSGENR